MPRTRRTASAHAHADPDPGHQPLPRLPPQALGRLRQLSAPSPPSTPSSASPCTSAAAPTPACPRYHRPYRPEAEPHFALPHHEFGLDVIALVGRLRHAEHRSVPEIHRELTRRGVASPQRTVTNLLDRYDELRALATADPERLRRLLQRPGPGDPGHRRLAARRRPRGPVGAARLPLAARCCWPRACCRPPAEDLAGPARPRSATPCRCRSPASSPTARTRSARRWPRPCRACPTSCATSTTCARRPSRSTRPTATPRRS